MKHYNEEVEILSHEEETHLDSNDNDLKISGDSHENLSQNKGNNSEVINQNLNIAEMNGNNNIIDPSQRGQNVGNNETDMESKLRNFEPEKHYKNYGKLHHHHMNNHSHQHDFSNPRFVLFYILSYIKMINFRIQNLYSGFSMTLDMIIKRSNFHPLVKRIVHSKQILLFIYIFNIQYLFSSVEKITFLNFLNKYSFGFMMLSIIGLHTHYYFYNNRLFIERDEELEKFVIKRNPQIKRSRCEDCHVIQLVRSKHCYFCEKCVKKFQFHSDWYNMCIGATNELIYGITFFLTNCYFFISNIIIWYYILVRSDLLNYLFLIFSLFGLLGIYFLFNTLKFLYNFIFESIFTNMTIYEFQNKRNLTYLWQDNRRNVTFNPFNKGIKRNIEEMFINAFDIDIYSDYKGYANKNLSEIIDDEKLNLQDDFVQDYNDIDAFKMMLKLCEHFDPFITSKGNIYKFIDGKEIINWNRLMIFTAFDIINSPFKDFMARSAKYTLQQRELYLEKLKNMKQNNEINNNDGSNENIENNENKENNENNKINGNNENNENLENNNEKDENNDNHENKDNEENNDNNENKDNIENNENNENNENKDNKENNENNENGES